MARIRNLFITRLLLTTTGKIIPDDLHRNKKGKEEPSSWHVVLNDVFFGFVHKDAGHWEVSEQRPPDLTEKVGEQIDH